MTKKATLQAFALALITSGATIVAATSDKKGSPLLTLLCAVTTLNALREKTITPMGATALATHAGLLTLARNNISTIPCQALALTIAFLYSQHVVFINRGFNNRRLIGPKEKMTPSGAKIYGQYLNLDQLLMAAIMTAISQSNNQTEAITSLQRQTLVAAPVILANIILTAAAAWKAGLIEPDLICATKEDPRKNVQQLMVWAISNLFFTCLPEATLYSNLQSNLATTFGPLTALLVSTAAHGITHFNGGKTYMMVATIAALGYRLTYQATGSLNWAMIAQYCLTLTHMLGFTYPFAEKYYTNKKRSHNAPSTQLINKKEIGQRQNTAIAT